MGRGSWWLRLVALLALVAVITPGGVVGAAPVLELYTRPGCPHCVEARGWAQQLRERRPEVEVVERDVLADPEARRALEALVREQVLGAAALPTFRVGDRLVVGFDGPDTTGRRVEALLDGVPSDGGVEPGASCAADAEDACVPRTSGDGPLDDGAEPGPATDGSRDPHAESVDVPLLGRLDARRLGLPLFTIAIGLVDGFNPCAMWVLLFLLAMLVNLRDRRRIALVAGTFVLVSGLAYYAFMAAWLNAFLLVGLSRAAQVVLGLFAVIVGAVHVKDFFALGKGISFGIPASAKPGIYARTRAIVAAKSLWLAVAGAFALAVVVNVIELLCTAGLPALYTQVLVHHRLSAGERYAYLALYDLAYMLDDAPHGGHRHRDPRQAQAAGAWRALAEAAVGGDDPGAGSAAAARARPAGVVTRDVGGQPWNTCERTMTPRSTTSTSAMGMVGSPSTTRSYSMKTRPPLATRWRTS